MKWAELDLDKGTWTIPAERTKNGRPHLVPLPSQAVSILEARAAAIREAEEAQKNGTTAGLPPELLPPPSPKRARFEARLRQRGIGAAALRAAAAEGLASLEGISDIVIEGCGPRTILTNPRPEVPRSNALDYYAPVISIVDCQRVTIKDLRIEGYSAAGIQATYLGSHVLRHSNAARQLDVGTQARTLSELLGHRDSQSLSAYVRIATQTLRDVSLPVPR